TNTAEFIHVSKDGRHFMVGTSDFRPWGFNYDHDASNRLLEDYWKEEWNAVAGDFQEMKSLGANTVRVHLQISKFMKSARETDAESLRQLGRLVSLAERSALYLDVTGLGCYKKEDVPRWYNELGEGERWDVQARFLEDIGKPMVIEEMFPLSCSVADLAQFIEGSSALATGWIGFYWGKTIEEYKKEKGSPADGLTREWL